MKRNVEDISRAPTNQWLFRKLTRVVGSGNVAFAWAKKTLKLRKINF